MGSGDGSFSLRLFRRLRCLTFLHPTEVSGAPTDGGNLNHPPYSQTPLRG